MAERDAQHNGTIRGRLDAIAQDQPARLALIVFAAIIGVATLLLWLPFAFAGPGSATFIDALFTATSAVCVTGLTVVNTAASWTTFGHLVIMISMMIGGLGVMTLASLLGRAVSHRIGLTQRMLAATETKSRLGEVGSLVTAVLVVSLSAEVILTVFLLPSFLSMGEPMLEAIWHSMFMAVSIFNNGGFVIVDGGIEPLVGDWLFCIPIIVGTIAGAIGFPVIRDLHRNWRRPRYLSLHAKLTISTYMILWLGGVLAFFLFEWGNADSIAALDADEKILAGLLHGTTARSSGLSTLDLAGLSGSTVFVFDALMFIGGGSASTAGGIKVGTFAVLVLAIISEARGDRDTVAFNRRIPNSSLRLAVSAAFLGSTLVGAGTLALVFITDLPLESVLFEAISAFATCGLSLGITPGLPTAGKVVLILLMFTGRLGTMTLAAALAMRERQRQIRFPEERPIIG
ncbi:TrkH family potassium uptake protein [Flaviflexus huanghaiensis]|uniref:TrkH family potassium uptake protein n=1 Tax=Flaviflexus huanghaiensis TaxID=1111473 RepID=UPI0015FDD217|nr:potassium transporter TrkG [Flaviflexus huanghaiensis]